MTDQFLTKEHVKMGDSKRPIVIFVTILVLIAAQFLVRVALRHTRPSEKETFVEDPNRVVFKEEDIARGFKSFGLEAKDSFLAKLKAKENASLGDPVRPERLAPIFIVKHEETRVAGDLSLKPAEPTTIGLPLGTKILASMQDEIFSFNVETQIETEVMKDIYYLGKLRIPKDTKFFGNVSIVHSEDRVNIHFVRLLLPWGEERQVRAVAHSLDGSGGIKGKVHRRWGSRFFKITGKTVLGAMTLLTVPSRQDAFSLDSQLRLNAASNLSQEASRELDRVKDTKAITVDRVPLLIVLLESI